MTICSGRTVTWFSQQESKVAILTTVAEIVAARKSAKEIIWMKILLQSIVDFKAIPEL